MTHGLILDGSGQVLSSNVYDRFGVAMDTSGSAQSPYRPAGLLLDEEGLEFGEPPVVCPLYANRALLLSSLCGGGNRTDWCKVNKDNPNPTKCQDCCDQKVLDYLKKRYKKGMKDLAQCITNCEAESFDDPEELENCILDCVKSNLGNISIIPIKQFLECCYLCCDVNSGQFNPPGPCKFSATQRQSACLARKKQAR